MPSRRSLSVETLRPAYKNAVGAAVRRVRNQREWTQEELAVKLQLLGWSRCTRSWLSRVEARLVAVRDYELSYFCKVFSVPLDALFPSLNPREIDPNYTDARPR